jgi:hypothetical protein
MDAYFLLLFVALIFQFFGPERRMVERRLDFRFVSALIRSVDRSHVYQLCFVLEQELESLIAK